MSIKKSAQYRHRCRKVQALFRSIFDTGIFLPISEAFPCFGGRAKYKLRGVLGLVEITGGVWALFVAFVLFLLVLDLRVFHRQAHVVKFKEALGWTAVWATLAMLFYLVLIPARGGQEALEFLTGYVIELSLSMDNVFVIALVFGYFRVPDQFQHRVLYWGILGALIMRAVMILVGTALVARFHWLLYVFGGFLVYSGIKVMTTEDEGVHPETNPLLKLARRLFPVTPDFVGQNFFTHWNGRRAITPLFLVLVMVETTDLVFALDSIPAIFAVTTKPFIIFTSNVFAILGLRTLYFVLAGAIRYFRFLKFGLALVLVVIGAKMLLAYWVPIPTLLSLVVVATIIFCSILASAMVTWRERRQASKPL